MSGHVYQSNLRLAVVAVMLGSAMTAGCAATGDSADTTSPVTEASESEASESEIFLDSCEHARPATTEFPNELDVVIGPLSYAGLANAADLPPPDVPNWHGGYYYKSGAQLMPGTSATITIDDPAGDFAAIVTEDGPDTGLRSVTYADCPQPDAVGSWWVGGFVLFGRDTACVPVTVTDAYTQATYHSVVSLGVASC